MTLSKLSLRNAKRQAEDYLIYFVTVVMAAALLYSFNGLVFSQEIQELSRGMRQLPLVIVLASIVVVGIYGWLVSYAAQFMLTRRSRELGTYLLIGLTNRQVARLFFLENLAVGGCALVLGTVLGGLLYQALRAIVLALFGIAYHFAFTLSVPAAGLTAAYFVLIYLYALGRSRRRIRRMKIYDLICLERQGEEGIRTGRKRRVIFVVSIVLGIVGTLLLMARDLFLGIIGAGFVILFLIGFFLSFASGVPAFFDKRPAKKYQGQTLLVFRTLTAKVAAIGGLMAVISLTFTATLIVEGTGMIFRGIYVGRSQENACFDLYIGIEDELQEYGVYLDYIEENIPVESSLCYSIYSGNDARIMEYLDDNTVYYHYDYERDPVMAFSDYAALRAIAGYGAVELEPDQYLIHCMTYLADALKAFRQPVALGEVTLNFSGVYTEHFVQHYGTGNGHGYILVVPDEAIQAQPVHHWAYAASTVQPVTEEQFATLRAINESDNRRNPMAYDALYAKADEEADVAVQTVLTVFPMYYLALSLTMTAAAILTIQQLSESGNYRRKFELLRKLGMSRKDMVRALRSQLFLYYVMPAVPPVLIGTPFLLNLARVPEPGVMVGINSPGAIAAIALALFFLIYSVYILLAYNGVKRSVLP